MRGHRVRDPTRRSFMHAAAEAFGGIKPPVCLSALAMHQVARAEDDLPNNMCSAMQVVAQVYVRSFPYSVLRTISSDNTLKGLGECEARPESQCRECLFGFLQAL